MTEKGEVDLPTNSTLLKIIKMLKSIKTKSGVPSPGKKLTINLDAHEHVEPLDSPYPAPDNQFTYDRTDEGSLYLSQQAPISEPKNREEGLSRSEVGAQMKRVTLNNFLGNERADALAQNKEQMTLDLGRKVHYSNLNIDLSHNKTNYFANGAPFRAGNRAQVVMNNFHAPMNHFLAMPNFNVVNSPRTLFSPNRAEVDTGAREQSIGRVCSEHQTKAQLVCLTDRKVICTNCALFGVHKGHDYLKFDEFVDDCRSKMAPVLSSSRKSDFALFLSEKQKSIKKFEAKIEEKKKRMFEQIERVAQDIRNSLREQEEQARRAVLARFEKFDAMVKHLVQMSSEGRAQVENVLSTLEKIEMTLNSDIPDVEFLLGNLGPDGQFDSATRVKSLASRLDQKRALVVDEVERQLGDLQVRPNQALLAELRNCFVRVSSAESGPLRRLNTRKSSQKGSARVLQSTEKQRRMDKQSSLNKAGKLVGNSVNFSLEKEFEDFQFNLELNKRLNQPSLQSGKNAPQKVHIYTDSQTSGDSQQEFDPVNLMARDSELTPSEELLSESPEKRRPVNRTENASETDADVQTQIRKSHTIKVGPGQKKSMKFLQEMKNKTRNFELMIKNTHRKKLKRSAKHHKSQKHFNPKLKELINFSENLIFEKGQSGSKQRRGHQKTSSLRGSGMLAGYLSDRKLQDRTLVSQFNEFAHARNLEFSRKASAADLSKNKFNRCSRPR